MQRLRSVYMLTVLMVGVRGAAGAHVGDRIFHISELADDDLARVDVHDGSAADWQEVLGRLRWSNGGSHIVASMDEVVYLETFNPQRPEVRGDRRELR